MTKQEYLDKLRNRLEAVHCVNINSMLDYYEEMINDRIEDGMSEEEAVADMETPEKIIEQVVEDMPMPAVVSAKVKSSRSEASQKGLSWLWITLAIVGFPIWLPLLLTFFILVASVYIMFWAMTVVVYSVELSFAAAVIGGIVLIGAAFAGLAPFVLIIPAIGAILLFTGLTIFMWFPVKTLTKVLWKLPKNIIGAIKKKMI